ncbi:Rv2629 family ribosome hibernation factor [Mycobacterium sp. IDR2000157661]|uniref:Rv2629 family ribosome hibernation factor n=1 Tax=Mycobacterium sp. IDR2000157661 TaxID=2867005 RepID=UPI001EEA4443|nr:hypothetical protein [Mycobacterium sp. IDR2000157661]ULE32368.1 hypothetical protein K3G64_19905 [Mycobacterium sp. IDR2000157661]
MHSEHFRTLLTSNGPYASVYFEDSHNTEDAAALLELRWRSLREQLEEQGADPAVTESIEQAVVGARPAVGRSGRAVVASSDGILVDEHLIRPAGPEVRVSPLPYLVPIIEHGVGRPTYAVVIVDHAGGDLTLYRDGTAVSDTVDGTAYPVHKAAGAETPGWGDPQGTAEGARQRNVRAVASQLTTLFDDASPEVVFVVGEVRSRADLLAELPERVTERVVEVKVGARNSGFEDDDLRHEIDQEFQRRRVAAIDDAAQRFTAALGRGEGLAAEGLDGVTAALRAGAVETLIIGDVGDATVVAGEDLSTIAPNPNVLSELGAAPAQTLRADEALPMVAISTGAELIRTDERIEPADGVAAILRYALR